MNNFQTRSAVSSSIELAATPIGHDIEPIGESRADVEVFPKTPTSRNKIMKIQDVLSRIGVLLVSKVG